MSLFPYVIANRRVVLRTLPNGDRHRVWSLTVHRATCPARPRNIAGMSMWRAEALIEAGQQWAARASWADYFPCTRCKPDMVEVGKAAEGWLADYRKWQQDEADRRNDLARQREHLSRQTTARRESAEFHEYIAGVSRRLAVDCLIAAHADEYEGLLSEATLAGRITGWLTEFNRENGARA